MLVNGDTLTIPYGAAYPAKGKIKLGGESLMWHQEGKGNIIATLPGELPAGTYVLDLVGRNPIDLAIGVQGPKGDTGATGPQGDDGEQGIQGIQGETGAQGPQGPVGPAGPVGPQGAPGETGATGAVGPAGPQGAQGIQGIQGVQGVQGVAGLDGTNGVNGLDGTNGVNGIDGTNGVNGVNGTNGVNGLDGTNGVNGVNGTNGGLVSNFVHGYAVGPQEVLAGSPVQFSNSVVQTEGEWSTNGTSIIIPVTGIYQISFMINADGADLTNAAPAVLALDIVDTTTPFNQGGLDQGYFQFNGTQTGALSGQIIESCTAGDNISLLNVSTGAFSFGSLVPANVPSATFSILQIK